LPFPPVQPLYEHLCALRDAPDPCAPRHDARWRAVQKWIEQAFPGSGFEDARQEALLKLTRRVGSMRAEAPLQAASWLAQIVKRTHLDGIRARSRDPVHRALGEHPRADGTAIDQLEAEDGSRPTPEAIADLVTAILEQVHRALEDGEPNATKRQLRRTQAQATLLRLLCGASAEELERVLDAGELGRDRIYKWIERGRPIVLLGLARWEESGADPDVVAAVREIVEERRADAGQARPDRRRDRKKDGP
jgi:DNA-directed RNA polymerase specialized sigma24 family protein